jgi:hypothetical protein
MIDPTPGEIEAMQMCRKQLAELLDEMGWETRPIDWTEEQVANVIEVIVTEWEAKKVPF